MSRLQYEIILVEDSKDMTNQTTTLKSTDLPGHCHGKVAIADKILIPARVTGSSVLFRSQNQEHHLCQYENSLASDRI